MTRVDVWTVRLDTNARLDTTSLDVEESRRAAQFVSARDRDRYLAAHIALRRALADRLAVPARAIAFARAPCPRCGAAHGRPILDGDAGRALHFSLSRSNELALIAIAPATVGVDVEALPADETVAQVSELLHPAERAEIAAVSPAERAAAFARIWTRKEAYRKGLGLGLAEDLSSDYLGTQARAAAPPGWTVLELAPAPGYAGAVAVQGQAAVVLHAGP